MRKTKIICTLGPATDAVLPEMIKAGMNVARMNFSHGSHEEHKARMDAVKAARKELGMPVGIMLDTKGPEIRTKTYKDGKIEIVEGQEFTLTTRDIEGDNTIVSITYEGLPNDVQPGTRILIDDGLVAFEVEEIKNGTDIVCKALNGGPLSNRKSINVRILSSVCLRTSTLSLLPSPVPHRTSATSRRSSRHTARKMLRSSARSRTWKA